MTLQAHNQRIHDHLDAAWLDTLEQLTAMDLPAAARAWAAFGAALRHHIELENTLVVPVYLRRTRFDQGGAPENFTGEHDTLLRLLAQCDRALGEVVTRRDMVLELEHFQRLRALLEHHDLREARHLYNAVEALATGNERAAIASALEASLAPGQRHG